jgi:hypothetical protein
VGALVVELESHDQLRNRDTAVLVTYAFGVPAVHAFHGSAGRVALSTVARIVLPALGGYLNSVHDAEPDPRGVSWGIVGGMAAASLLDAILSRD